MAIDKNSRLAAALLILMAGILASCKTAVEYIPVETVKTEYQDRIAEVKVVDSVVDSRIVYVKGDTMIAWRDRIRWRDREVHDSIYSEKADTINIPFPIEKTLTRWEKVKMNFGGVAIVCVLICILILLFYLLRFCYSHKS